MEDKIFEIIKKEERRQREQLQMIPSENYASSDVRGAVGSVLMNKYSEGQAGKRYYQGNKFIDEIEVLCKNRALKAFGLSPKDWGVNVQVLSGSPANLAVYNALLQPGDKILSMALTDGGHLSHGWRIGRNKVSFVSKIWDVDFYHVDPKKEVFDYEKIEKQAVDYKPKMLISGGTAYPREIDHKRMGKIARKVGAYYLADVAHEAGLIASGENSSPFPYAHVVTMTTHKTLRGPRGALIFARSDLVDKIDRSVFPGLQGGPHNQTIAGIAVALNEAQGKLFSNYAKHVVKNAQVLAEEFSNAGLHVVSGGTDKHLVLLDLRNKNLSGWVAAWALEYVNIIVNRNTVPGETASPYFPSGLRMGTPALTTRGMKEKEMEKIAGWIVEVIEYCGKWKLPEEIEERKKFVRKFEKEIRGDKYLRQLAQKVRDFSLKFSSD